jgi:hypothetical protein
MCVAAGYLFAEWWFGRRDTTELAKICARVDYINGLRKRFGADIDEDVREQLSAAVVECRSARRSRAAPGAGCCGAGISIGRFTQRHGSCDRTERESSRGEAEEFYNWAATH